MNNGEQYVSLFLANRVYEIPRAAASKSVFLDSVLNMQAADKIIPVPFIRTKATAQVIHNFLCSNPIFKEQWPPRLCYNVLLAANSMDMPDLLNLCATEIATRWCSSITQEIQTMWGLENNFSEEEKRAIQKENLLLEIFDTNSTNKDKIKPWAWPPEMLFLILSKLPTRKLAYMRGVCAELYDVIHSLPGRGDLEVSVKNLQKNTNIPFVERHCLLVVDDKQQLESLPSLQNLKHLKICPNSNLGVEGAIALSTLQNLTHLEIRWDNTIGAEGATALSALHNLKELIIHSGNNIGPEGANALATLQNLNHLVIKANNNIGPEGVAALSALQNLQHLVIGSNNKIGTESAAALSTLQNLQHLVIGPYNNIGLAGATALSFLKNLQYLEIGWGNNIGPEGAVALSSLRNLEHLEIDCNNLGAEGANALSSLQNLTYLEIGCDNNIGPEGAAALSTLQNLTHLEIWNDNNIGTEGIRALFHLKNLQTLKIARDGNQFSKTDEKILQEVLPGTTINFY